MPMWMWRVVHLRGHLVKKVCGTLLGYLRRFLDYFRVGRYDLIYVFMWVTPLGSSLPELIVRKLARKLVFDVEDNVFVEVANEVNFLPRLIKSPNKVRHLVESADHVITSSPFLNDRCETMNVNRACTFISSSVDTARFVPADRTNGATVTIGWTGTFTSRPYLDLLQDVFARLAKEREFRLLVIGNFEYELPGVNLEVRQWSLASEVADMQALDIGIYPLEIDEWVLGKSGLKAIQYMAFGIPTVATRVGTTIDVIDDGVTGLLVESEDEWLDALRQLVDDADMRRAMGSRARDAAVARYSRTVIGAEYLSILEGLDGKTG